MRFLYVPALFLYHPDDVEYVLTTNPKNFIKSMSLRSNFFQRLVGNGLLTSQGEEWKRQRRLVSTGFSSRARRNLRGYDGRLHAAPDFAMASRRKCATFIATCCV